MKKAILFRAVIVLVAVIALGWLPQSALAQRGGGGHGGGGGSHGGGGFHGGGGGGFHGGGGGGFHGGGGFYGGGRSASGGVHYYSGSRGGASYGGYHGGGYYGGHGYYGGYGWGRGYGYGYGGWGWGWGFGYGWPYWGYGWGYPYYYGYGSGYYAPYPYYSYPYYGPSGYPQDYPDPNNGNDDPPAADPNAQPLPNQNGPARYWRPPVPGGATNPNYANNNVAAGAAGGPVQSVDRMSAASSYRAAGSTPAHFTAQRATTERVSVEQATAQANAPLRPEVQRALQRLREMPPFAREREIETGSYRQFSPEEKQILRNGE